MEDIPGQPQQPTQPQQPVQPQQPAQPQQPSQPQLEAGSQIIIDIWDTVLAKAKGLLSENSFTPAAKILTVAGNYALMLAAVIGLLYAVVTAIKFKAFTISLGGLGWIIAASILLYVAVKFMSAGETLIKANPTKMSSSAFLDTLALLGLVIGVAALLVSMVDAIKSEEFMAFFAGVGTFIFCGCIAWIALNPNMVNIEVDPDIGAGEDAIGILSFFTKGILKFVPIAYGAGVVYGTILFTISFVKLFWMDGGGEAISRATESASILATAALIPLLAYVSFLFYYLAIDLIQSVLSLPRKIDRISKD